MFAVREYKYAGRVHKFSGREHKYALREHKIDNEVKTSFLSRKKKKDERM